VRDDPNEDRIELLPIRKDDGPEVVHEPNLEIQVYSYDELGRWFEIFGRAPRIQLPVGQAEHRKPQQEDSPKESLERGDLASPRKRPRRSRVSMGGIASPPRNWSRSPTKKSRCS
jgi:hypothetical protein